MQTTFWETVVATDYAVPEGHDLNDLTDELVGFLNSPDPLLRDEFGYFILAHWIKRGVYTDDQLRGMAMRMVTNFAIGLGQEEDDSVFVRSFSAILLAEILQRDNTKRFLLEQEVRNLFNWAILYLESERDRRGYIVDKGWAHAAAHASDLLRTLALSRYATTQDLERMLMSIALLLVEPTPTVYIDDEDERLVRAVRAALRRDMLSQPFLDEWLKRLGDVMTLAKPTDPFDIQINAAYQNTKHFLRSLMVSMMFAADLSPTERAIQPKIADVVKLVRAL